MLAPTADPISPVSHLCYQADPRDPLAADWFWWLFAAHGRHVKAVARRLDAAGVPHLVPMRREVRTQRNRTRYVVDAPIFGNYLFVAGDDEVVRNQAMSAAPGNLHLGIPVLGPGREELVRDLANLLAAIESGAPIGKARPAPKAGDRFRVVDGPWEGMEGTLIREACGATKMVLCVHALGQGAELNVDAWRVEAIEDND